MAWSNKDIDTVGASVRAAALAALLAGAAGAACAAEPSPGGIYTCVDGKGRRLTADRPIIDCIDREQTELSSGGIARRKIGPSLTAAERAAEEDKARRAEEDRSRQAEEKRREKALVARYPTRAVHDKERADALALVDSVTAAAQKRTRELQTQRKFLDGEVEFYKPNPAKMPPKLKRQIDEVDAQLSAQQRFVADQEVEKVRVNARFDEELARLRVLWAQQLGTPTAAPAPATTVATVRAAASASRPASSSAAR
jgi:hypothetical protein